MNTSALIILIGAIPTVTLLVVGTLYGYGQLRRGRNLDEVNDAQRWEKAISLRETEIADLQKQIDTMQVSQAARIAEINAEHTKITVDLQAQINALIVQVAALVAEKKVLAETVTGKDILDEIAKSQALMQQTLSKFEVLLAPGGMLAAFAKNDADLMGGINDIKKSLDIGKREKDAK